jgi:hypothetical protein
MTYSSLRPVERTIIYLYLNQRPYTDSHPSTAYPVDSSVLRTSRVTAFSSADMNRVTVWKRGTLARLIMYACTQRRMSAEDGSVTVTSRPAARALIMEVKYCVSSEVWKSDGIEGGGICCRTVRVRAGMEEGPNRPLVTSTACLVP